MLAEVFTDVRHLAFLILQAHRDALGFDSAAFASVGPSATAMRSVLVRRSTHVRSFPKALAILAY
jgi:hypothetical protein